MNTDDELKHLHLVLPTGLVAAVDALAKKDLLTRSGWITRALLGAGKGIAIPCQQ